jgi:hypothetical protein
MKELYKFADVMAWTNEIEVLAEYAGKSKEEVKRN